jgi:hypothetical protein
MKDVFRYLSSLCRNMAKRDYFLRAYLSNPSAPSFSINNGWQKTNYQCGLSYYAKSFTDIDWNFNIGAEFQPPPPYPFGSANDSADVEAVLDAQHLLR